jgi:hypothetical protein
VPSDSGKLNPQYHSGGTGRRDSSCCPVIPSGHHHRAFGPSTYTTWTLIPVPGHHFTVFYSGTRVFRFYADRYPVRIVSDCLVEACQRVVIGMALAGLFTSSRLDCLPNRLTSYRRGQGMRWCPFTLRIVAALGRSRSVQNDA